MKADWFIEWFDSPFYKKMHAARDSDEARRFAAQLMQRLQVPPAARILDTAAGTGVIARMLHQLGYEVTAVDNTNETIDRLKTNETDSLQFFLHDLRLPFWGNYFHSAINLFTQFGYYRTRREHDAAIRTIASSLQPGGFFVIDYLNPHYLEDHPVYDETMRIDTTDFEIHRWDDELNFYKKIGVTDPSLSLPLEITETYSKLSLGDFTDMFSFQGLQVQEVFGGYDFSPYDVRSTARMIIVAQKAKAKAGDREKRLYSDGRKTDALT